MLKYIFVKRFPHLVKLACSNLRAQSELTLMTTLWHHLEGKLSSQLQKHDENVFNSLKGWRLYVSEVVDKQQGPVRHASNHM